MTKKDYKLLADALIRARITTLAQHEESGNTMWRHTVVTIANALDGENPRFSKDLFYKACGLNREE